MFLKAVVLLASFLVFDPLRAQSPGTGTPATRSEEIESARRQKSAQTAPQAAPSMLERALRNVRRYKLLERFTSGTQGLRAKLGGLVTGSGFAMGPEYVRPDLAGGSVKFRTSAVGSIHRFYLMDAELSMPQLADGLVFINFYGVHRDFPRIDYYGPGPDSKKSGRSDFLLEDTSLNGSAGLNLTPRLRVGAFGRYLFVNVGPGRDTRFASTDTIFSPAVTPGIQHQTNFLQSGPFAQYDYRDNPIDPHRGGNYVFQFSEYLDRDLQRFSFGRMEAEVQQYIPLTHEHRVIALRGRLITSQAHSGNQVPFYLQPVLGGDDTLRGFRPFRFYDNDALLMNAEYRWQVFGGFNAALFVDAGKVFPNWDRVGLDGLEKSYGFGFRFHVGDLFARVDTGFSREGFQVWLKFDNVF